MQCLSTNEMIDAANVCLSLSGMWSFSVSELAIPGAEIGRISASDADLGENAKLEYTILEGESGDTFNITGVNQEAVITLNKVRTRRNETEGWTDGRRGAERACLTGGRGGKGSFGCHEVMARWVGAYERMNRKASAWERRGKEGSGKEERNRWWGGGEEMTLVTWAGF